mgnify:CR=1 FL=1
MSALRPEVSIHTLNEAGGEYLPGYLGIEMLALDERRLNSRMPVKKLHAAPNEFLHAASVCFFRERVRQQAVGSLLRN